MSAGVSDQRMKSQGNPGSNVCKEQLEGGGVGVGGGEELVETWRHHQQHQQAPSYSAPISSPPDPYTAQGYYGTAGTAFQYQSFGVGDGTWSTNGTDPMTFLGNYAQHDSYAMDGVFGPSTTAFSTATFGQPTSAVAFNYFNSNGDYSTWGGQLGARNKPYDDYYRQDGVYMPEGIKGVEAGVQGLSLVDSNNKLDKELLKDGKDGGSGGGVPKKTWATIASQPAKPQPSTQSTGLKKKGPGMPPPPIIPGKHNMDIGTWDGGSNASSASKPISNNNGPGPSVPPPPVAQPPSPMSQPPPQMAQPPPVQQKSPQQQQQQQQQQMPMQQQMHIQQQMVLPPQQGPMQGRPTWAPPQRAPMPRLPPPQPIIMQGPSQAPPQMPPPQLQQPPPQPILPHPVLDELKIKNNYNPPDFDLTAPNARFFVIKSYSEDDIHRSIKYEIWCSTDHGNKRLDTAFRECENEGGLIYLFFSVNSSGHFCGMAQMMSAVDYNSNSSVWSQDKWKGQFKVHWIYVKDVPNNQLRHIQLENNDNKPVTNSRDTQEVLHPKGLQLLRIMHSYKHSTSIFDDFIHYEKRQEEEDQRKVPEPVYKGNHHQGNYEGKPQQHGGYDKRDSYGGGKPNYNREYNRDQGGYNKDHGGGYNKEHGGYNKDHDGYNKGHGGGYNKDHGGYNKDHGGYNKDHGGYNKDHSGYNKEHGGGYNKDHGGYNKDHDGYNKGHGGYNKDHGNGGDGYGGGGNYKGHRGGDREQHGGYRDHRDQQGGGYRPNQMHKDRGDGSRGGGRGRRPN